MENQKTYKREVAVALMLFLMGMFVWGVIEDSGKAMQVAEFLTLPIFTFLGGAFALDAVFKQGPASTPGKMPPLVPGGK
jgi:hypothetical protein